jgi:signal transduction histidine kinase
LSRVLLLLDQKENQRLLAEFLELSHDVAVAAGDGALDEPFDLCVVDGRALDRAWERVQARKAAEEPLFLPVLLLTSRPGVKMVTRHVWQAVDELIVSPVERHELLARVEVLLRARSQSLELRRRADEAREAARTRDEVLAVVSHDLRNPINLVLTSSSFVLDILGVPDPVQREQLDLIKRAAGQMSRLIQDLLDVSTIEAGKLPMEAHPQTVESLMEEACEMFATPAAARRVALSCHNPADSVRVMADAGRVSQLFGNLLGNALKFTPDGGEIRLAAVPDGAFVRFSVADTGKGIEPDELPHVFERFWQARRTGEGSAGLGLAISRGIVNAHGGEMWVESELGNGTTFFFTLPLATAGGEGEPADADVSSERRRGGDAEDAASAG